MSARLALSPGLRSFASALRSVRADRRADCPGDRRGSRPGPQHRRGLRRSGGAGSRQLPHQPAGR
ncbi:hypothetical protein ACFFX0_28995 [Citricoccus parietis]|uniref:Uncharacterized protein n=1 Tax=Citricoccus parietis TaxID=592307 RepID=A0ABV5G1F1_9MICC